MTIGLICMIAPVAQNSPPKPRLRKILLKLLAGFNNIGCRTVIMNEPLQ